MFDQPLSAVFQRLGYVGVDQLTATTTDRILESLKRRKLTCLF